MQRTTTRLPLTALRTFEAAARHLSFKTAAAELCVSATTVSNQIRQLEKDWGFKLFHRHTRAVSLTRRGESLAQVLSRSLADIRDEIDRHVAVARRPVSIAVGPIFGSRWLGPRLARFSRDNPGIELVVQYGTRISGVRQMETDLVVDWGVGQWQGLRETRLLEERYSPIISPALASQFGPLTDPAQVARIPIIHQYDHTEWQHWFRLAGCPDLPIEHALTVADSNTVQHAVKAGQGVALGVFPFMDSDVAAGVLIKPFDLDLKPTRAYYLLERPDARRNRTIRTVCEWIEAEAQVSAPVLSGPG